MRWFGRAQEDDLDYDLDYDPTVTGLPYGFEPPPDDRLAEVAELLDEDVATGSPLGLPDADHPIRPLHIEEAVERIHNETQSDLTRWARRQQSKQPALLLTAQQRQEKLTDEDGKTEQRLVQKKTDLDQQRAQLSDPDLGSAVPVRTVLHEVMPLAVMILVILEIIALQPFVGQVIRLPDWKAWSLATFAVSMIMISSYFAGAVLHRWLTYEGPRRIRWVHAVTSSVLMTLALISLAGIVAVRLSVSQHSLAASLIYIAMQGGIQSGAGVHGWWQHNPRVRQIKMTEHEIEKLDAEKEELAERIAEVVDWAETLTQFHTGEWLTSRRVALAEAYAATVLQISRNTRCRELARLGHHDSVNLVRMLPLPQFKPPLDPLDDDGLDWLSGVLLTL